MDLYPRERSNSRWDTGTAAGTAGQGNLCILCLGSKDCTSSPSAQACSVLSLFSDLLFFTPVVEKMDIEIGKPAV